MTELPFKLARSHNINAKRNDGVLKLIFYRQNTFARHVGIHPKVEIRVPPAVTARTRAEEIHRRACWKGTEQDAPNDFFRSDKKAGTGHF